MVNIGDRIETDWGGIVVKNARIQGPLYAFPYKVQVVHIALRDLEDCRRKAEHYNERQGEDPVWDNFCFSIVHRHNFESIRQALIMQCGARFDGDNLLNPADLYLRDARGMPKRRPWDVRGAPQVELNRAIVKEAFDMLDDPDNPDRELKNMKVPHPNDFVVDPPNQSFHDREPQVHVGNWSNYKKDMSRDLQVALQKEDRRYQQEIHEVYLKFVRNQQKILMEKSDLVRII